MGILIFPNKIVFYELKYYIWETESFFINNIKQNIMSRTSTNLLFLAVGAALGAAVTYVATSDHKEEWLDQAGKLIDKIKGTITGTVDELEEEIDDLIDEAE